MIHGQLAVNRLTGATVTAQQSTLNGQPSTDRQLTEASILKHSPTQQ
jgi:hypothetical protein